MERQERIRKFYTLVIMFFIVSFTGWLIESTWFLCKGSPMDRGYLTLPLCTVYGCALLAIYFAVGTPRGGRLKGLFARTASMPLPLKILAQAGLWVLYFLIVAFLSSAVEFVTGLIFDKVFGVMLWNYSYYKYNLMGYICLVYSVLWGVLITLAMGTLWPLMQRLVDRLSYRTAKNVSIVLLVLLGADFLFSTGWLLVTGKKLMLY